MKKYFSILAAILFCSMSFALTACGDDDDDEPSANKDGIEINGVRYSTDITIGYDGGWNKATGNGFYTMGFNYIDSDGSIVPSLFLFNFESDSKPKVGDDLTKMDLWMGLADDAYKVISGKATITSIDNSQNYITVKYENLKLSRRSSRAMSWDDFMDLDSYTINGSYTSDCDLNATEDMDWN